MSLRDRPIAVWAFPVFILVGSLLLLGSDAGQVAMRLRGILFDAYQHAQPRQYQETLSRAGFSVRVLDSDPASLARFGPWPWPRTIIARLTRELKANGAAMVAFAFPLDIPDPMSPKRLLGQVPPGPASDSARDLLRTMPSPDDALVGAMSQLATVTGFVLGEVNASRAPVLKAPVTFVGTKNPFDRVPAFSNASGAIAAVEHTALGTGALNLLFDADGKLRRMPFVFRLNGRPVPAFAAELLRLAQHSRRFVVRSNEGESGFLGTRPGIASFEALNLDLPTAPDGSMWIAFSGQQRARNVSAAALDENRVAPARFADAIVILGPPGDTIATPDGARSVAEVYAEALENALTGAPLRRPASAIEAELICLAIFGLACVILFARFGVLWSGLFTLVSIAGAGAVSWHLYTAEHVLFDALGPSVALALVCGAGALGRGFEVRRTRARVRMAFAESLPPHVIEQIARKPELLSLDGVQRSVTYLSCGVRGFGILADSFKDDPAAPARAASGA